MAQIKNLKFNDNVLSRTGNNYVADAPLHVATIVAESGSRDTLLIPGGLTINDDGRRFAVEYGELSVSDESYSGHNDITSSGMRLSQDGGHSTGDSVTITRHGLNICDDSCELSIDARRIAQIGSCGDMTSISGFGSVSADNMYATHQYVDYIRTKPSCCGLDILADSRIDLTADSEVRIADQCGQHGLYTNTYDGEISVYGMCFNLASTAGADASCGYRPEVKLRKRTSSSTMDNGVKYKLVVSKNVVKDVLGETSGYVVFAEPS